MSGIKWVSSAQSQTLSEGPGTKPLWREHRKEVHQSEEEEQAQGVTGGSSGDQAPPDRRLD